MKYVVADPKGQDWNLRTTVPPSQPHFLVIEDQLGVKPTHGVIVTGDGARHRIENTDALRARVLDLDRQIRAARAAAAVPIPVSPKRGQCRPCGMRGRCAQARL
jgi:CRISPR-associated exonuclease Cas4